MIRLLPAIDGAFVEPPLRSNLPPPHTGPGRCRSSSNQPSRTRGILEVGIPAPPADETAGSRIEHEGDRKIAWFG